MQTPTNPQREQPSTYVVQNRSNEQEMLRLRAQNRTINDSIGGVLPEQGNLSFVQSVIDIGCGTGNWLIETAKTYPTISRLVGVDISRPMLSFAQEQAEAAHVTDRVEFRAMDALRMLEFPDRSFDLVNQRFSMSYLRTWDWPKLLSEHLRITRRGGIVRITECALPLSTSSALNQLNGLGQYALSKAGHYFVPDEPDGVISELPALLVQHGFEKVQSHPFILHLRAGTPEGEFFVEDEKHAFRTLLPFLQKWAKVPDNYEEIYQQAVTDMEQPDFAATWNLLTVWGIRPSRK